MLLPGATCSDDEEGSAPATTTTVTTVPVTTSSVAPPTVPQPRVFALARTRRAFLPDAARQAAVDAVRAAGSDRLRIPIEVPTFVPLDVTTGEARVEPGGLSLTWDEQGDAAPGWRFEARVRTEDAVAEISRCATLDPDPTPPDPAPVKVDREGIVGCFRRGVSDTHDASALEWYDDAQTYAIRVALRSSPPSVADLIAFARSEMEDIVP